MKHIAGFAARRVAKSDTWEAGYLYNTGKERKTNTGGTFITSEREGYYPLDGGHGILVRSSHFPDIGMDTFEVDTQKEYTGSFEIKPPKW